jgi:hypothetical protein
LQVGVVADSLDALLQGDDFACDTTKTLASDICAASSMNSTLTD